MRAAGLIRRAAAVCALAALCAAAPPVADPALAQRGEAPFQTTPGGLQYRDLQVGDGAEAEPGDIAEIHFVGWLDENGARGRQIYNSRDHGRRVSFVVGTDRVMEGWNQAVVGMRVGGRRMVLIPPQLAFGDRAIDDVIPARAFLIMIVELVGLRKADE